MPSSRFPAEIVIAIVATAVMQYVHVAITSPWSVDAVQEARKHLHNLLDQDTPAAKITLHLLAHALGVMVPGKV